MTLARTLARYAVRSCLVLVLALAVSLFDAGPALAHCDGLDGPVVQAARLALQMGDVNRVLIWVRPDDASAIRQAFHETMATRSLSAGARELADRYFFETLVRVHRAGEGAGYTGLKPAGRDLGPAIPAADAAIGSGSLTELSALLTDAVKKGLHERFHDVLARKSFDPGDVAAGRAYVESYVTFIHYVERLHAAAVAPVAGHHHEAEPDPKAHAAHHHDA